MFRAILWDNDGVLVDTEKYYFLATRQVLAAIGVDLSKDLFREFFLRRSQGAWHLAQEQGLLPERIEALRVERNALYMEMLRTREIGIEGVEEILQRLKPHFTMGIVTSSHRVHFDVIHKRTGFLRFFDFILTREDYTHSKPHPAPYLCATDRMRMKAEDVLAIEDSERGLLSAKGAGLTCWVVPNGLTSGGAFTAADKRLSDIRDLPAELGMEKG